MQFKVWYRPSYTRWFAYGILSVSLTILVGFGFYASLIYYLTLHRVIQQRQYALFTSLIWGLMLIGWWMQTQPPFSVIWWYVVSIPFAPIGALLIEHGVPFIRRAYTSDIDETLKYFLEDRHKDKAKKQAKALNRPIPSSIEKHLKLASEIETPEPFPDYTGIKFHKNWLYLDEKKLSMHGFILGSPGSGKTSTIKWIIHELLVNMQDWNVYVIDAKGELELAEWINQVTYRTRGYHAPIFRLGHGASTGSAYNPFVGDPMVLYNRLLEMTDYGSNVQGGAAWFKVICKNVLQLVCYAPEPHGSPRDFFDLEERFNYKWLLRAYKDSPTKRDDIYELRKHIAEVALWYKPLIRDYSSNVHRKGFTLGSKHARVAVFSIKTTAVGETGRVIANLICEDANHYMGNPDRQKDKTLFIIDEFQSLSNQSFLKTMSQGRSANLGLFLATQDLSSLLDDNTGRNILANANLKIIHNTEFPDEIAQLGGTKKHIEKSFVHEEEAVTPIGSARVQDTFMIDPNQISRLAPGQAFVLSKRRHSLVQFRMVDEAQLIG